MFLDRKDKIDYFPIVMDSDTYSKKVPAQKPSGKDSEKGSPCHRPQRSLFGHSDKALISLAVKCRLIPRDSENGLLDELARKKKENAAYSADRLFKETQTLTDEDISFLFAVRDHLEMKMLDKKFGELGVAGRLIQPESVQKALDIQSAIFKETSQSKLIGDILLENSEITEAGKAAILLTQDRIKEELLFDALNDIAESQIEKLSLNMRFGAIAVKKNYITIEQLNQALAVQKAAAKTGKPGKYLGHILKDQFGLEDGDLNHILNIQKEMEKKRLALEQALDTYNSETNINKRLAKRFEYRFTKKKLEAYLIRIRPGIESVRTKDLKQWLATIGITRGICPDHEIEAFMGRDTRGDEICIARGRPPEPGKDGMVEFFFDTQYNAGGNEAEPDLISRVKKGEVLARLIPEKKGKAGVDVSGFPLPSRDPVPALVNSGDGVIRDKEFFIAGDEGIPILFKGRTLFVKAMTFETPTRHYTGSIDMDLGEEYKDIDLKVDGSILENGRVRCRKLTVSGDILGQVSAAGDIKVKGNIGRKGDPSGIQPAQIRAEGDILPGKSVFNAIIITGKSLVAPNADLTATAVQAYQDITVKNIGHYPSRPCVLQTGKAPGLKADSINALIREKSQTLDRLRCGDSTRELEAWFREKMVVRDGYLYQHHYLNYALALMRFAPLSGLKHFSEKLMAAGSSPGKWPDLPEKPKNNNPEFISFETELLRDIREMAPDALESYLREQARIKYGMYKAAVNAGRRHTHKYETRKKAIGDRIEENRAQIEALESTLKKLIIQKDRFLLSQAHDVQPVPPAIRVKHKTAKGTVIKGKTAKLTIDQDIYGVKFTETPKTAAEQAGILIQGFYD